MIALIGTLVTSIGSMISNWIKGRQDIQKAKQQMKLAEIANRARLLQAKENNNHEWEMAALADKDKWIRRISFIMFSAPFIIAIIAPEHVANYFKVALTPIPEWFKNVFVAINGSVWGISALKNPLSQIAGSLKR